MAAIALHDHSPLSGADLCPMSRDSRRFQCTRTDRWPGGRRQTPGGEMPQETARPGPMALVRCSCRRWRHCPLLTVPMRARGLAECDRTCLLFSTTINQGSWILTTINQGSWTLRNVLRKVIHTWGSVKRWEQERNSKRRKIERCLHKNFARKKKINEESHTNHMKCLIHDCWKEMR